MSWKEQARSVFGGYQTIFTGDTTIGADGATNLVIAAMIGLAHLKGCPDEFQKQAGQLVLDGNFGPVLIQTLTMFRRLCE